MSEQLIWLVAALALSSAYWLYCGAACARSAASAKSFFLADRDLPAWVFVLAGTGACFPAWIVLGHAALVARAGFPFAETALCAITIPLAGVLFLKRQWMLGRRYGYVTPAEMLGDYYGGEAIRIGTVLVALVFAIPFLGMQASAVAQLIGGVSGGLVDPVLALWGLTGIVFAYTCVGGLRAAAVAGASQALLLAAGAVTIGAATVYEAGGFAALSADLARLAATPAAASLEMPGIMQFVRGLGVEAPVGSPWTAAMVFGYCLALMGLQIAPAFGMLAFATRSPKGFAMQQTWAAAGIAGAVLVVCITAAGVATSGAAAPVAAGLPDADPITAMIGRIGLSSPWFVGILAVAMLAGVQVFAALNLSAASTMVVRDFYRRYIDPDLAVADQRRAARIAMGLITLASLLLATFAPAAQAALGTLALGFGLQLLPALAGLCWLRGITREGVAVGLVAGLVGVVFTEPLGGAVTGFFGLVLPWGRWPWTIHSGAWGLALNVAACLVVSLISQRDADRRHRSTFHLFLASFAGRPAAGRSLRPLAWALTLAWMFFAIGPGAIYGTAAFGDGHPVSSALVTGLPSLWIWQIVWWALGVLLIWFLAYRLALSTGPAQRVEPLPRSQRPRSDVAALTADQSHRWFFLIVGIGALAILSNWLFD